MSTSYGRSLRSVRVRVALLSAMFVLLAVFFVSPPVRLIPALTEYATKRSEGSQAALVTPLEKSTRAFLDVEHNKVIDEIKSRILAQDTWFHYKFILTGGMIALFLGQLGLAKKEKATHENPNKWLKNVLTSESTYSILVLSCVVALIIDMHIRSHNYSIQLLGLWLANYVEPSYVSPKDLAAGFRPWEQFIRIDDPALIPLNNLYRFAFSFHLHFMTILIYLLYALMLQGVCLGFDNNEKSNTQKLIVVAGFLLVHGAALAFVFVSHAVPGAITMQLIPFDRQANGLESTLYYSIPLLILTILQLPYLLLIRNSKPTPGGQ